jgi:hypothetical protein
MHMAICSKSEKRGREVAVMYMVICSKSEKRVKLSWTLDGGSSWGGPF